MKLLRIYILQGRHASRFGGVFSCGFNLGLAALLWLGFSVCALSCGVDFQVPTNHFDGVAETGELSWWREIGKLDFGDGLKIPLVLGFKPTRGGDTWLGRGWILPVLESNFVQVDERKFLLTQPDGITRQFWRKNEKDTTLKGQGNWVGEIKESTINLWASCGWKLSFYKGKITSITTPKNRVLNIVYTNGRATEIREKDKAAFKVESDPSGIVTALVSGSNRIGVELSERPRVEVIKETNVIGGMEKSLHALHFADDKKLIFDFSVDEKVQPTLDISETDNIPDDGYGDLPESATIETLIKEFPRHFTWNPKNGYMVKDGEWIYDIEPGKDRWANAAIGRVNAKNAREFWFNNKATGKQIFQELDGSQTIEYRFPTGPMAGAIRKVEKIIDGKIETIISTTHDEKGKLIRQMANGTLFEYEWDNSGKLIKEFRDKKLYKTLEYKDGNIDREIFSNGLIYKFKRNNGILEKMGILPNGSTYYEYSNY